jgi:tRNA U34 2-thiouridine synthase MnmA/TrmU
MAVAVNIRSAHGPMPAMLFGKTEGGAEVMFDTPGRAVAPGQACVFSTPASAWSAAASSAVKA